MTQTQDIVERLRAEIERLQHEKSQWQPIYQALDRDRARLRAALQRIADDDVDADLKGRADILSGIAWAALSKEPTP